MRRARWKKKAIGAKRHGVPYLLMIRGSQQETAGETFGRSVGRGPSSSQSPYPSLPAYAESSLIPMLVLSPRKPLRWVFAGAPVLLKFSAVRPRRTAIVRRRVQDRFDLRFPSAAALPTWNRPSHYLPAALSDCARRRVPEPTAAKRRHLGVGSGERGKRRIIHSMTTPKAAPTPPNAEKHPLCSSGPKSTPVPALKFLPDRPHRPPFCPNLTAGKDLGPSGFSFRRAAARCFGAQPTRSGGS